MLKTVLLGLISLSHIVLPFVKKDSADLVDILLKVSM